MNAVPLIGGPGRKTAGRMVAGRVGGRFGSGVECSWSPVVKQAFRPRKVLLVQVVVSRNRSATRETTGVVEYGFRCHHFYESRQFISETKLNYVLTLQLPI